MKSNSSQPIGLFDSGVGGLTVAHAIKSLLPGERLIYFGDTLHLPYGDKSSESIKYYSLRITDFLLQYNCKVILIACNTASALAYQEVKKQAGKDTLVLNVIDPVVDYVAGHFTSGRIGVIGTKGTINSGTYRKKISGKNEHLEIISVSTPLLVPMIEEGFIYDDISNAIIRAYLSDERLEDISGLILGCTHYPIIKRQIEKFFNFNVRIIDSAVIMAERLKQLLEQKNLLNTQTKRDDRFYISDYTDNFAKIAKLFFEDEIKLEKVDLWT